MQRVSKAHAGARCAAPCQTDDQPRQRLTHSRRPPDLNVPRTDAAAEWLGEWIGEWLVLQVCGKHGDDDV